MRSKENRFLCSLGLVLFCAIATGFGQNSPKLKIVTVEFDGNESFASKRLYRVILSRPSSFLNRSNYYPDILRDDLESLVLFYRQNGFLDALIEGHDVAIDTLRREVAINIRIKENPRTFLEGASILGNTVFTEDELLGKTALRAGNPLELRKIQDGAATILRLYADNGYLDAQINPDIRVNSETHLALVDYIVQEGLQYEVGGIELRGLEKTKPTVIHRELTFRPGQILNYSQLLRSQRRLYLTGLFQSVFTRPDDQNNSVAGKKNILIELKENDSGSFNTAVGYGSIERVRGRLEFYNTNVSGTARKIAFSSRLSSIIASVEASFTEPWTFGVPWSTDINLLAEYQDEPGYDISRYSGRITLARNFLIRSSAKLSYTIKDVRFRKIKVIDPSRQTDVKLNSLTLTLVHDTRDNLFNTTQGSYLDFSNEVARSLTFGGKGFFRSVMRMRNFRSFGSATVLAASLQLGWIAASGGIDNIPLHERFYAGGPNSLRGFDYQRVGPLDQNRTPHGGTFKLESSLELRRVIYKMIGGVVFVDLGNVMSKARSFGLAKIRSDAGLGLRLNTPIGLARVDFGLNLKRRAGEDRGKIYFSMGHAF